MKKLLDTFSKTAIGNILGVMIVVGCFVLTYFMMVKEIPQTNVSTINQAVGFVFAMLGIVVGYFFGSSKKDEPPKNGETK